MTTQMWRWAAVVLALSLGVPAQGNAGDEQVTNTQLSAADRAEMAKLSQGLADDNGSGQRRPRST
jgi:hypothetical protein